MQQKIFLYIASFCVLLFLIFAARADELKLEILNGHSGGGVLTVAVSADGRFALTGSNDKTALLWDLETGKQLRRFVGHEDAVSAVQFSKDGKHVLTASHDKTARLWETATGKQIRVFVENRNGTLVGHSGKILAAAISTDGNLVATAGEDETARIWDAATGKQLFQIKHAGRVNSIAFSPDSVLLLTGGEDKIAWLYSTATGKKEKQFVGHTGEITSVAYSPDGKQILTASMDGTARLWNAETTAQITKFTQTDRQPIYTVAFTQNGKKIYAADRLYDVVSGQPTGFYEHKYSVPGISGASPIYYHADARAVSITPDESRLLIVYTNYVSVVDVISQKETKRLLGKSSIVNDVAFAPNLPVIFTAGAEDTSGLWNINKAQILKLSKYKEFPAEIHSAAFSNSGEWFVSKENNSFILRNASDGKFLHKLDDFGDEDSWDKTIAVSADNRIILRVFKKDILVFSRAETGETLKSFSLDWKKNLKTNENTETIYETNSIALSPDGKTVAVAANTSVGLWNAETGEVRQIIKDFLAPVWSVAFSPDGKTIATASGGEIDMSKSGIINAGNANAVRFFDVETGKETGSFGQIYESVINKFTGFKSVAYSPDNEGRYVAAGSFDGKVYLRDNATKTLRKFEGHTDAVNSVKFAKDANSNLLVVSGSSDSTTRIWNAATGEEICALVTFRDGNWAVVQTATGRYDAPNGGEIDGIQWVFGNETIALSQLKDIYYTPNLLPRLLGYKPDEPLKKVPALANLKLFPKVLEKNLDAKTARLNIKLQSRGGGIGAVRVMVNGKMATSDARDQKLRDNPNVPKDETVTVSFDLTGSASLVEPLEQNTIEVIISNYEPSIKRGNISSNPEIVTSRGTKIVNRNTDDKPLDCSKPDAKCPTLFAIVGGVSDYNGTAIDLNYAAKDAEDFANALEIGARRMLCPPDNLQCAKVQIKLLTSGDAAKLPTKKNFENAFAEVARQAKPEDILVVYLAGHGASLGGAAADNYFFLTKDADNASPTYLENNLAGVTISDKEIIDWITQRNWRAGRKGIDAQKQVLILDTCAAGAFANNISLEKVRDGLKSDQIRAIEKLKDLTGFQILMGSSADKSSYESSRYEHGLLTYALLQGMKGAALKQDKFVDTQTLFVHAKDNVKKMAGELVGGIQDPRIFGESGILIGLMQASDRDRIKILASPLPVFVRPNFVLYGTAEDPKDLTAEFGNLLDKTSEVRPRGGGAASANSSTAFVYYDNTSKLFAGAYRVTGTYTESGEEIILKAVLQTGDVKKPLGDIRATTAQAAAAKLLEIVLKELATK